MKESVSLFFFSLATILFVAALAAGWVASTDPVSSRKGKAKFLGYACVGLAFIAFGIPMLLQQSAERTLPFAGTITAVHQTGGNHAHANLRVGLKDGGSLTLHADGRSQFFRPGQAVSGQYASPRGTLLYAKFFGKDGTQQGVIHGGPMFLLPYGIFLLGAFAIFAGWLLYRRDPQGANLARR